MVYSLTGGELTEKKKSPKNSLQYQQKKKKRKMTTEAMRPESATNYLGQLTQVI